jgi:hypothetical protein
VEEVDADRGMVLEEVEGLPARLVGVVEVGAFSLEVVTAATVAEELMMVCLTEPPTVKARMVATTAKKTAPPT